ncbi:exosome complex component RRP45 [Contarinia nasturtii]|uniref:exosome complex component RRP45 n=1 Tax=Contarinia nasturtii TaxID=265458 RepID=UPI0012D3E7A3|nr:exosome complex component RRP45 [Contarinia nasturtii]
MTDIPLSTCEKNFIIKCLSNNKRLDGRAFTEFRNINIHFGVEWGCALVSLGETKVLAQVSCEITQPRATRPSEGILYVNINSGQDKRNAEHIVLLTRNLERALKESRCVDLESLCIKAEEKVWRIRVDLNILNHEGNLIDCASVAALASLAHFKRPDVTITGEEIQIHSHNERDPIPIVLHHHPVCVSYAIYENGAIAIADPSLLEERRSEATVVFGINSYRELCGLHFGGITLASLELLIKCANQGAKRANAVVKQIKAAIEADEKRRANGEPVGFMHCLQSDRFDSYKESRLLLRLPKFQLNTNEEMEVELEEMKKEQARIQSLGKNSAVLMPIDESSSDDEFADQWIPNLDGDEPEEEQTPVSPPKPTTDQKKKKKNKKKSKQTASSTVTVESEDSEEEETMVLEQIT